MQLFFHFSGAPDVVQHVNHRFGGGLDDIGRQAHAVEAAAVIIDHDIDLAQRVFALALSRQVILHQFNVVLGNAVNRLVDGIDRTVAVGGFGFDLVATGQLDGGGGDIA